MENRNLFFPPIVLYQYQHGDKIRGDFYNIAIDNSKFYWLAIDVAALQGAAERIVFGERDQDIYIACPFDKCPYFKTALCHRKYPPPNKSSGWEQCTFPKGFINMTNRLPDQAFEELRFLKRPPDLKLGKRLPENRAGMLAVEFEQYCRKLGSASLVLQSDSSIRCNQCGTYNIVTSYFVRGRMPSSIASLCGKCSREKRVDLDDMSKFSTFHAKEPHELI